MKARNLLVAGALAAALIAVIATTQFRAGAPAWRLLPDDAQAVARGQKVYQAHCAACHGARLEGQPHWRERSPEGLLPAPPHDESGHTWHHTDEVLFRITKYGVAKAADLADYRSAMPAYEGLLSDAEIVAALSWIKSQWPARIRERHDQMNAQR
jgi:mono/diheme cytochrome c family protein